jgi:esterase/lipase
MFMSHVAISKLKCTVKIIHGEKDNIVPVEHGKWLYEHAHTKENLNYPAPPVWYTEFGHNDLPMVPSDVVF